MLLLKKVAFSFGLAVFLFACFAAAAYTGLFHLIEARFYNPAVSGAALDEAERDRDTLQAYFAALDESFAGFAGEQVLRRGFLPNRNEDDAQERERLAALLHEKQYGLLSVRFIDSGGSRILFSTLQEDLSEDFSLYRSYEDDPENPPYQSLAVPPEGEPRLIPDRRRGRIIFSYPFYDALETYRGTVVFTLAESSLTGALLEAGRIRIGEDAVILEDPPGILLGLPPAGGDVVIRRVAEIWKAAGDYHGRGGLSRIVPDSGNAPLVLASSRTGGGVFIGRLFSEKLFVFSPAMKSVLLLVFFLTSFLTIFLLFNVRPEPMTVVRTRLRGIRAAILEECRSRKDSALPLRGWEMEQRREDVRRKIKKTLKTDAVDGRHPTRRTDSKLESEADAYIDSVWDEIEALAEHLAMPHATATAGHPGQRPPAAFTTGSGPARSPEPSAGPGPHTAKPGISRRAGPADKKPAAVAGQNRAVEMSPVKVQTAVSPRPLVFAPESSGSLEPSGASGDPAEFPAGNPGENPESGQPVFKNRNGITYINRVYTAPDKETVKKLELDENFKELVNSVIDKR
jgi:hypothetical protein